MELFMQKSNKGVAANKNEHKELSMLMTDKNVFDKVNNLKNGTTFNLMDGPPYANGSCHLGHALNKVWKDLSVKYNWVLGNKVDFMPGWDCNGLPLELLAEKSGAKTPEEKVAKSKRLAMRSVFKQKNDFRNLSVNADWKNPYLTMSSDMTKYSWKTLKTLFEKDLLEYKQYPTHHCPACGSSLAEAELEYMPGPKHSLYFKVKTNKENTYLLVWTTTPWTLPMNQGVVYNQSLDYVVFHKDEEKLYSENNEQHVSMLLELGYVLSDEKADFDNLGTYSVFDEKETVLVEDAYVEKGKTGFVHLACAHGVEDFLVGQKVNLGPLHMLNKNGVYTSGLFEGKKQKDVASDVVEFLKQKNMLVDFKTDKTDVAHCWRHKTPVYYSASNQVFLKLDTLKPKVKKLLDNSNVSVSEKLKMMLDRPHWCLSRQRYHGTPMNLVVNNNTGELDNATSWVLECFVNNEEYKVHDFLVQNPHLSLFTDVVDVWFDSGNVSLSMLYDRGMKADLVCEGHDQFRGWFQSLMWLHVACTDEMPYKEVLVHGFVLDETKNKFSKSSKNGMSLEDAVKTYGADVVRIWAGTQDKENDPVFSKAKMQQVESFYKRMRLTLRFMSSNLNNLSYSENMVLLEKFKTKKEFDFYNFVLGEMNKTKKQYCENMNRYEYRKAFEVLFDFCDDFLSKFVFEVLKPVLYLKSPQREDKQMAQVCLMELFHNLSLLTGVFCPNTVQEFWNETALKNEFEFFFMDTLGDKNFDSVLDWFKAYDLRKKVPQAELLTSKVTIKHDYTFEEFNKRMHFKEWLGCSVFDFSYDFYHKSLKDNVKYEKCSRCWTFNKKEDFVNNNCSYCNNCL